MFEHIDHSYSSSLLPTTEALKDSLPVVAAQRSVEVPLTTLDRVLAERTVTPGLLVKLDVQGFEDRVIRGGKETFRRAEGAIVEVILDSMYESEAPFKDTSSSSLDAAGLRFSGGARPGHVVDGHVSSYFDAVFLRPLK